MAHPIVVAVAEDQEAHQAIALGVTAARLLSAPLVLAGIVVTVAPGGATVVPGWAPAADPTQLRAYVARDLHRQADAVPDDVPCTINITTAVGILPGLEMVVEHEHAQLLVVGASHLGPLARAVRGDIGLGAVRHAGCSVLIVPEGEGEGDRDGAPLRRLAVAWDGSDEAETALDLAAALAERGGADLTILRASAGAEAGATQRSVDDATGRLIGRVACTGRVLSGSAAGALVEAGGEIDLLVIGARRHALPATPWLGSVSAAVLRHARCPVLVVPQGARVPAAA